eukprot:GFKZ01012469.1.p1 GENE.GFKZ01012469.1~~GFKZ01012469.1.p1  ORF type:complete len:409 (-),score=73.55 GFKZ01012469.1:1-1227(-)
MPPLKIHDIHIEVLHPDAESAPGTSSIHRVYILPRPTEPARSNPPTPISLDDIKVEVSLSPAETLFYSSCPLSPEERETVSKWLEREVSLTALHRLSEHLVRLLSSSEEEKDEEILETRIQVVAEATAVHAAAEAEADGSNATAKQRRVADLREQRTSISAAVEQFEEKISSMRKIDSDAADLLVTTRAQLREKLRFIAAELSVYGEDQPQQPEKPKEFRPFAPELPEYLLLESESELEESDAAAAVRAFPEEALTRSPVDGGYVSSESDDSGSGADDYGRGLRRGAVSIATALRANYVIDLDGSPVGSLSGIGRMQGVINVAPRQGDIQINELNLDELEGLGAFSGGCHASDRLQVLTLGDGDSDDLDDLESSAEKGRSRGRENSLVVITRAHSGNEADDEDEQISF